MTRLAVTLIVAFIACLATAPSRSEGWGQWKGRIVDAETKQPLEGVVVLAYWLRSYASVGGWAASEVTDVEETTTGPDGRFSLPSHMTYTIPLIVKVDGPETIIFKSGYGRARPVTGKSSKEILFELPKLRDPVARREFFLTIIRPFVADDQMPRLNAALDAERRLLGAAD
jgi:hypothetical protein